MDQQRPFLYLSLFFLGFLIWSTWQQEHAPKPPVKNTELISKNNKLDSAGVPTGGAAINKNDSNTGVPQNTKNTLINEQLIHVKTDVLDLYISTSGGTIVQADLPTYPISLDEKDKPIRIIDKEKSYAAFSALIHQTVGGNDLAPGYDAPYQAEKTEYILQDGQKNLEVKLLWQNDKGLRVIKTFYFERGAFLIKQIQQVNNQMDVAWTGRQNLLISHGEHERDGSIFAGDVAYTGAAYYNNKYIKVSFGDIEDDKLEDTLTGGWAAMIQHYFVSAWIPPKELENTYFTYFDSNKSLSYIGTKTPNKTINAGQTDTFNSQFYIGPTDQDALAKISEGLDLTVDYGIFSFVSKPIFAVMSFINKNIVSNWGWTIILLTVFIKIIFFYPSAMSMRSMARMKKLQPKIKALGDKYKNDPQAKQKATMEFYRKEKINPLGGCLPMLIQMPVFMGLYWVLQESVELRQAPWILWYKDLSVKDALYILPVIYGISMYLQQKLSPTTVQDPMQQKIFTYLPVVFTFMFLFFPAGLVLYWVVNNILTITQQYFINKKIIGDTETN